MKILWVDREKLERKREREEELTVWFG